MITPKENLLRIMNHQIPEWIPNAMEDTFYFTIPELLELGPETEDTPLGGTVYDWFGVHWTFVESSIAATPTPN